MAAARCARFDRGAIVRRCAPTCQQAGRDPPIPVEAVTGTADNGQLFPSGDMGRAISLVMHRRLRAYRDALLAAKHLAGSGSRAESEFRARMRPDVRSPINGIIGMTE